MPITGTPLEMCSRAEPILVRLLLIVIRLRAYNALVAAAGAKTLLYYSRRAV